MVLQILVVVFKNGGSCGIRTHGAFIPNGFQDRRINPSLPSFHPYNIIKLYNLLII
nr:MAG TPA: hypothetical protein [Caudoviricetes sp.]